jgi:hypothetical protein
MEDKEIIIPYNNNDGLPGITRIGYTFLLTHSSVPHMPDHQFDGFFKAVRKVTSTEKNIIIDFKIGLFSSNTLQVLKKLFEIISLTWFKCKATVNWYYLVNDEEMKEYGEMYQEWNPNLNFNFVELND